MRVEGFRLKRLINNLQLVGERIGHEDLPVTIKELYVFGSIVRKKRPGDVDVVAIYGMNDEQKERWGTFYENLDKALNEFNRFDQGIPLPEVVAANSEYFVKMGIEPNWVSCFSWSNLYNFCRNPLACNWRAVVRKKLTKGMKGVHIQIAESLDYFGSPERFLLAWSLEKPDIQANLTALEPKLRVLAAENGLLRTELQDATEKLEVIMMLYTNTRQLVEKLSNVFEQNVCGHTFDEILAYRTILFIPKRRVKEKRIREILKEYCVPADKIEKVGARMYKIKET